MEGFYPLVLAVLGGVAAVTVAIIAALRLIPRPSGSDDTTARLEGLEAGLEALRLSHAEIADHYEITTKRNATRVGKLRRKVRRLEGDDPDEDDDVEPAPELPLTPATPATPPALTKAELWANWNAQHPNGGHS